MLGKTNMDEFAMGSSTENSRVRPDAQPVGPRPHPRRLRRRLGGRGRRVRGAARRSAPTPAARSASPPRSPASVGVKPTYGGVSRYGLVAFSSSLDQAGPVRPHGAGRRAAARGDRRPRPAATRPRSTRRCPPWSRPPARRRRRPDRACGSAWSASSSGEGYRARRRWRRFRGRVEPLVKLGAEVVEVSCPHFDVRAAGLLPDRAERGARPTWPASTRCGTGCASATTATARSRRSWR